MSDLKNIEIEGTPPELEAEENREALDEGMTRQDFKSGTEPAEGHTTFDDDKVTPRLNDGR